MMPNPISSRLVCSALKKTHLQLPTQLLQLPLSLLQSVLQLFVQLCSIEGGLSLGRSERRNVWIVKSGFDVERLLEGEEARREEWGVFR
ncbi:hypothetical protein BCR35DRAFT_27506 [Leucosporidium creatinivorum]|uniref:Uncharacterized protein n=1 Tax=Leucosporidium creatinivorum TaxID=106004 RepID=A0A1Y2CM68_9BASI|nr:hypothetical protein BCR35DRAFT_27506 [Leucosporidium creatinivorum]